MRRRQKKSKLSKIWFFAAVLLLIAVTLSLFAEYFWFFDLFSHFVFHYTVASLILFFVFFLSKTRALAIVMLGLFATQGSQLYHIFKKTEDTNIEQKYDTVTVLQFNVYRYNKNIDEVTKWIISKSEEVDFVILSEINDKWADAIRRIKWAYPYNIVKDMRGGRQMAVFSRLYIDEIEVKILGEHKSPVIALRGETTGYEMPFVLYGIHPPPPMFAKPYEIRNDLLLAAAESMAGENNTHKLIVSDFNITRFSPWFEKTVEISGLKDSNEGLGLSGLHTTWPNYLSKYLGITIDNILISDNIKVVEKEVGASMGSDHYPLITTLQFLVDKNEGDI